MLNYKDLNYEDCNLYSLNCRTLDNLYDAIWTTTIVHVSADNVENYILSFSL